MNAVAPLPALPAMRGQVAFLLAGKELVAAAAVARSLFGRKGAHDPTAGEAPRDDPGPPPAPLRYRAARAAPRRPRDSSVTTHTGTDSAMGRIRPLSRKAETKPPRSIRGSTFAAMPPARNTPP